MNFEASEYKSQTVLEGDCIPIFQVSLSSQVGYEPTILSVIFQ